jgi:hypothetical protein
MKHGTTWWLPWRRKKRKGTNRYRGFFVYYAIWWEGKIGKKILMKAYFGWIESVLASHEPYL